MSLLYCITYAEVNKYTRFLKRVNDSKTTVRSYAFIVQVFLRWVTVPTAEVTCDVIGEYIGFLHHRRLRPKTINCYLDGIRRFYEYLTFEERRDIVNPVKNDYKQILPKPLPRFLKDQELRMLLRHVTHKRDRAILLLMLRCGLRVGEVASLTFLALDFERRSIQLF